MTKKFHTKSKKETWEVSRKVLKKLNNRNVVLLKGDLGAGKTTFSQGVLKTLGAEGPFTSPTFVIMKEYPLPSRRDEKIPSKSGRLVQMLRNLQTTGGRVFNFEAVYHLDCYRVEIDDVLDLGWDEIVSNPKNLVLVEWPEKIEEIWPKKYAILEFEIAGESEREIKVKIN